MNERATKRKQVMIDQEKKWLLVVMVEVVDNSRINLCKEGELCNTIIHGRN
jgi:hypothetical protein